MLPEPGGLRVTRSKGNGTFIIQAVSVSGRGYMSIVCTMQIWRVRDIRLVPMCSMHDCRKVRGHCNVDNHGRSFVSYDIFTSCCLCTFDLKVACMSEKARPKFKSPREHDRREAVCTRRDTRRHDRREGLHGARERLCSDSDTLEAERKKSVRTDFGHDAEMQW